jgi:hypothetical protein
MELVFQTSKNSNFELSKPKIYGISQLKFARS